jgi:hypothetical protein
LIFREKEMSIVNIEQSISQISCDRTRINSSKFAGFVKSYNDKPWFYQMIIDIKLILGQFDEVKEEICWGDLANYCLHYIENRVTHYKPKDHYLIYGCMFSLLCYGMMENNTNVLCEYHLDIESFMTPRRYAWQLENWKPKYAVEDKRKVISSLYQKYKTKINLYYLPCVDRLINKIVQIPYKSFDNFMLDMGRYDKIYGTTPNPAGYWNQYGQSFLEYFDQTDMVFSPENAWIGINMYGCKYNSATLLPLLMYVVKKTGAKSYIDAINEPMYATFLNIKTSIDTIQINQNDLSFRGEFSGKMRDYLLDQCDVRKLRNADLTMLQFSGQVSYNWIKKEFLPKFNRYSKTCKNILITLTDDYKATEHTSVSKLVIDFIGKHYKFQVFGVSELKVVQKNGSRFVPRSLYCAVLVNCDKKHKKQGKYRKRRKY